MEVIKKYRSIISVFLILFSLLIFSNKALASEASLPSGIKDSEIGDLIEDYIYENKDTTAAVSIAVFRGDQTLYQTAYGYANIEDKLKADDETVYEWGSVSKLLVWTSIMQLWEQGLIDLEADVKEYLPEDFFTKLKYDQPITMLNLMNHNAGFEDAIFQMCAESEDELLTLEEALKVTEPHQNYRPGEVVAYSNWSSTLAGYIVERISGMPYYEYVQKNIFNPLDMNHTGLEPAYSDNPWVKSKLLEAEGYTTELVPMEGGLFYINLYPSGSTAGTLDDMLKFAKALQPNSDGSKKLFKNEETLNEMLSPTLKYPDTEIDYINHGLWSHEYNVQALGHGGNTLMYSAYLVFDPVTSVGAVIMTNQGNELTYYYGLPPMIFGKVGEMAVEEERNNTSDIKGLYYSARTIRSGIGKMYTAINIHPFFDVGEDKLNSNFLGLIKQSGRPIAPNTFLLTTEAGATKIDNVARYSNNNGLKKLSSPYGESVEADGDIWAVTINIITSIILAIVPFGYTMQFFRKRPKLTSGKTQKASYVISMFMGFVITLTVIVLEMYKL